MKTLVRLGLFALLCAPAQAQFYAPPVDFHDVAQRRFPVEAARVLAWQRKGTDPQITEIAYRVELDQAGQIVWLIDWRTQKGSARKVAVRYPEAALRGGAEWYRDVWKQLTGKVWALAKSTPGDLDKSFWQGAESAGITRMEGVSAALAGAGAAPGAEESARRAGMLVQSALPMLAFETTLDGALLARSAAWLCAAEQQAGTTVSVPWAPLLALAHREQEAKAAWGAGAKLTGEAAPLGKCWEFVITLPPATVALPEIARPENRLYAAPVFQAYEPVEERHFKTFIEIAPKLYAGPRWERLQDYAPYMNFNAGHPHAPTLPLVALRDWLTAVRGVEPLPGDLAKLPEQARGVHDFEDPKKLPLSPSPELAALLNSRLREGEGPLIPVGIVTGRDLLVYGWESGGVQFACVQSGLSPMAAYGPNKGDVEKNWTGAISGWEAFCQTSNLPAFEPLADVSRLELVSWTIIGRKLIGRPPAAWPNVPDAYFRRRWLTDLQKGLDYLVVNQGKPADAASLLRRGLRESGPRSVGHLLVRPNLVWEPILERVNWPDLPEFSKELRQAVPMNARAAYRELGVELQQEPDAFKQAQALERWQWEFGLGYAPHGVFAAYVRAHAYGSAQRFYERWRNTMADPYLFASTLGSANLTLAALENDEARVEQARKEIGGTAEKRVEMIAALLRGDVASARTYADMWLREAPPTAVGYPAHQQLLAFFDLLPALNDLKHPDHEKALDAFPKKPWFLVMQWVMLAKAHLPKEEAIRFLGSDEQDANRQLVTAALRGDKAGFEELYKLTLRDPVARGIQSPYWMDLDLERTGPTAILTAWLHNVLFAVPVPAEEPDLRPPGAEPLGATLQKIAGPLPGGRKPRR